MWARTMGAPGIQDATDTEGALRSSAPGRIILKKNAHSGSLPPAPSLGNFCSSEPTHMYILRTTGPIPPPLCEPCLSRPVSESQSSTSNPMCLRSQADRRSVAMSECHYRAVLRSIIISPIMFVSASRTQTNPYRSAFDSQA